MRVKLARLAYILIQIMYILVSFTHSKLFKFYTLAL